MNYRENTYMCILIEYEVCKRTTKVMKGKVFDILYFCDLRKLLLKKTNILTNLTKKLNLIKTFSEMVFLMPVWVQIKNVRINYVLRISVT